MSETKNAAIATRELENMSKNISTQMIETNKGSVAMQKMVSEVVALQLKRKIHEDKLDLLWAAMENQGFFLAGIICQPALKTGAPLSIVNAG